MHLHRRQVRRLRVPVGRDQLVHRALHHRERIRDCRDVVAPVERTLGRPRDDQFTETQPAGGLDPAILGFRRDDRTRADVWHQGEVHGDRHGAEQRSRLHAAPPTVCVDPSSLTAGTLALHATAVREPFATGACGAVPLGPRVRVAALGVQRALRLHDHRPGARGGGLVGVTRQVRRHHPEGVLPQAEVVVRPRAGAVLPLTAVQHALEGGRLVGAEPEGGARRGGAAAVDRTRIDRRVRSRVVDGGSGVVDDSPVDRHTQRCRRAKYYWLPFAVACTCRYLRAYRWRSRRTSTANTEVGQRVTEPPALCRARRGSACRPVDRCRRVDPTAPGRFSTGSGPGEARRRSPRLVVDRPPAARRSGRRVHGHVAIGGGARARWAAPRGVGRGNDSRGRVQPPI